MANGQSKLKSQDLSTETTLHLLSSVESGETVTQRGLASDLGVALGLTNALIKRCVKKGYLKVRQAPARRFAYYLTPRGFAEKSALTAEYLSSSLSFYRRAREEYAEAISFCANRGWRRIALAGAGELAEIAILTAREFDVELLALVDAKKNEPEFFGIPVVRGLDAVGSFDAVLLVDTGNPQAVYDTLTAAVDRSCVIAPRLLHVSTKPIPVDGADD